MNIIERALHGETAAFAFLLKILFTALTIGAGFKGGEIVPSFFTGATFGCLFAILTGASVGWHQHVHDTEPYYILKGEADFIDNDKSVTKVGPGDCCIIEVGQYHSIENNSDSDVEFMALIYNEPGYLNDRD